MTSAVRYSVFCLFLITAVTNANLHAQDATPPITALAVSPNGQEVIVGSQAGLEGRNLPELRVVRKFDTQLDHIHDLAFAPNGKILVAVGGSPAERGTVELYEWPAAKLLDRIDLHEDLVYSVAWLPDSLTFAVASSDNRVSICEIGSKQASRVIEGHSRGVLAVAMLPGEHGMLTAGLDESIRIWDLANGSLLQTLSNHTKPVTGLAVRPISDDSPPVLASIGLDLTVRLWQPTIGRLMRFARLPSPPLDLAWLPGGTAVVTACKDGMLRVVDSDSIEILEEIPAFDGVAYCLCVLEDGNVLVGGQAGQIRLLTPRKLQP